MGNETKKENILLLSDAPPCTNYSGGIFLNQLSRIILENGHNLFGFIYKNCYLEPAYDQYVKNNAKFYITDFDEAEYDKPINIHIASLCVQFIKKYNITQIWCYVQNAIILQILDYVMNNVALPVTVQIMDPLEWHIIDRKYDAVRKKQILELLDKVINKSQHCITASERMNQIYLQKYTTKCDYLTIHIKNNDYSNYVKPHKNQIVISMAGQVYCHEELKNFLTALEKMNWNYQGKPIIFQHFGNWQNHYSEQIDLESYSKDKIFFRGFVEQNNLIEILCESDFLYCPYFFSQNEAFKKVCSESFPSKLATYLASAAPALVHAPEYASPSIFVKEHNCAYRITANQVDEIEKQLKDIFALKNASVITANANDTVEKNFTKKIIENKFLKILNFTPMEDRVKDSFNILEVNNTDLPGRRFDGYDFLEYAEKHSAHHVSQFVTAKYSSNKNVFAAFTSHDVADIENRFRYIEESMLSVHSQFSVVGRCLENSEIYQNAGLVHYHLLDNIKIPLPEMNRLLRQKPAVLTLHDLWPLTGRCIATLGCEEWKNGCTHCDQLNTLFSFKQDNCAALWRQKLKCFEDCDIDLIVATDFVNDEFVRQSPILKNIKNVHILPFGVDLNKFRYHGDKEKWREHWNIPSDHIVLFFRSQMAMKGTEYIKEALELLTGKIDTDKITLLTCSEVGNLEELKEHYSIIELGNIEDEAVIGAFAACDIFLMPSKSETFGLMSIESMACSRPVIVFNNMALPSVTFAPECGVLVENLNSAKLMEAILFLIQNPDERERRGKLGRELAEKHYDINVCHEKLLSVYEQAYERQKYKLSVCTENSEGEESIDYSNKNVQLLMHLIKQNTNSDLMFGFKKMDMAFIDDNLIPIDYSDDEAQKFLNKFNSEVFRQLQPTAFCESNEAVNCCNEGDLIPAADTENTFVKRIKRKLPFPIRKCLSLVKRCLPESFINWLYAVVMKIVR